MRELIQLALKKYLVNKMLLKIKEILRFFVPEKLYTKMYLYRRRKYFGQRFIDFDLRKYLNFKKGFFY